MGLTGGLLWQGAGGSLGEVRWGRALCQRVPYLVLRAPAQEFSFLIRAGQGVAAAVTTHVECGVHGVGEVGGLQGDRGFRWVSGWALQPGYPAFTPIPSSSPTPLVIPSTASLVRALEAPSSVLPAHLVRVQGKVSIQ